MAGLVRRLVLVAAIFGGIGVAAPAGAAPGDTAPATPQVSMFVIGDGNASVGSQVTFWAAQWAKINTLSGGSAPDSFKGFAVNVTLSATGCSGSFTTSTGNSSDPPSTVPGTIYVLVANSVTQSGPVISGTFNEVVAVQVDPGYGPDPGHAGTGVVIGPAPGCSDTGGSPA